MALPRVEYWLPEPVTLVSVTVTVTAGERRSEPFDHRCHFNHPIEPFQLVCLALALGVCLSPAGPVTVAVAATVTVSLQLVVGVPKWECNANKMRSFTGKSIGVSIPAA